MDADAVGEGDVGEVAARELVAFAVEIRRQGAGLGIDRDDGADVAVEHALVVVVAQLDELVAGAELPRGRAQAAAAGVQRGLELQVEVAHARHSLVHGREHLHIVDRVHPVEVARDEFGAEREHLRQAVLGRAGGDEMEVAPGRQGGEIGGHRRGLRIAAVDGMGRGDDQALVLLAIDGGEAGDGNGRPGRRPGRLAVGLALRDQVLEHVAGPDRRELVDVADEQQVRAGRHGGEQRRGEPGVEHGGLVDDEEIGRQRRGFVDGEAALGGVEFQQAVDGGGKSAGGLGEALGGPAGGGGEVDPHVLGLQDRDERPQDRGLAGAGSAGEDAELVREGPADGGGLQFVKGEAGPLLRPDQRSVDVDRRQARCDPLDARDGGGDPLLGAVVGGGLDQCVVRRAGAGVTHEGLLLHEGLEPGADAVGGRLQQLGAVVAQGPGRVGGVALLLQRLERVEDAGVDPGRGIVGKAQVDGDAVRRLEADALDLAGHPVGLGQQHRLGLAAIAVHELDALGGGHAVGLQEDVDLAQGALLVPGLFDGGRALRADARHAAQARGLLAEHAEGVGAELVDDLVGVHAADARDEAAAEVAADAVDGRGQLGSEGLDLELVAMLAVARPPAGDAQGLAALHAGQGADDGDLLVGVLAAEFGDRVVILLVEEDDALEHAGEAGGGIGHRLH